MLTALLFLFFILLILYAIKVAITLVCINVFMKEKIPVTFTSVAAAMFLSTYIPTSKDKK